MELESFSYGVVIGVCRCREKQRKESSRLQTVNRKLTAMNKLLMEENDRLQKQVSQLVCENGYMRQHLHTVNVSSFSLSLFDLLQYTLMNCIKMYNVKIYVLYFHFKLNFNTGYSNLVCFMPSFGVRH